MERELKEKTAVILRQSEDVKSLIKENEEIA